MTLWRLFDRHTARPLCESLCANPFASCQTLCSIFCTTCPILPAILPCTHAPVPLARAADSGGAADPGGVADSGGAAGATGAAKAARALALRHARPVSALTALCHTLLRPSTPAHTPFFCRPVRPHAYLPTHPSARLPAHPPACPLTRSPAHQPTRPARPARPLHRRTRSAITTLALAST